MKRTTRKVFDILFSGSAYCAVAVMVGFLVLVIGPVFAKGIGAYVFRGTIESRRLMLEQFGRGNASAILAEWAEVQRLRQPIYDAMSAFEKELENLPSEKRKELKPAFKDVRDGLAELLGPEPDTPLPVLMR
ncbi:MAG: hypothetical protein FWH21_08100, partial [Kiritimatiellaeota bacterium]|nr:hypothetical protein [Kiritimatiellota bacterium]